MDRRLVAAALAAAIAGIVAAVALAHPATPWWGAAHHWHSEWSRGAEEAWHPHPEAPTHHPEPRHRGWPRNPSVAADVALWRAYRAILEARALSRVVKLNDTSVSQLLGYAEAAYKKGYEAYKNGDYVAASAWAKVAEAAAESFIWAALREYRVATGKPLPPPPP